MGHLPLDSEIELLRIAETAVRIEERHRRRSGLPHRHGSKRIVERGGGCGNRHAVVQVERCGYTLVRRIQIRGNAEAQRVRIGHARIERMREEDASTTANHGLSRAKRLPGESETWAEIPPMGGVRRGSITVQTQEFHYPRSPRDWIDLIEIEAVHAVVLIDHWRVGLPTQSQVERKVAA